MIRDANFIGGMRSKQNSGSLWTGKDRQLAYPARGDSHFFEGIGRKHYKTPDMFALKFIPGDYNQKDDVFAQHDSGAHNKHYHYRPMGGNRQQSHKILEVYSNDRQGARRELEESNRKNYASLATLDRDTERIGSKLATLDRDSERIGSRSGNNPEERGRLILPSILS